MDALERLMTGPLSAYRRISSFGSISPALAPISTVMLARVIRSARSIRSTADPPNSSAWYVAPSTSKLQGETQNDVFGEHSWIHARRTSRLEWFQEPGTRSCPVA